MLLAAPFAGAQAPAILLPPAPGSITAPSLGPSIGTAIVSANEPAIEEVVVSAPEPRYVAPTTRDHIGRIWAPVLINGKGPYRLVLDTGASRSAVIQRVVTEAGLPLRDKPLKLRGVTGSAVVPAVHADSLAFGELLVEDVVMPVVANAFGGADGVLGSEGMEDKRIEIQFLRDRISIARSHRTRAPAGFAVVPFEHSKNRGMRIKVMVGSVKTTALIDSGAQVTVGNTALRVALSSRRTERDVFDGSIMGVTEDIQEGTRVRIPTISAGALIVKNPVIMFTDVHILDHWQLKSEPALILGMDVLGSLDTLVIDYRRNELHIKTRPM